MGKWALFSNPPIALIVGAALVLLGSQLPKWFARKGGGGEIHPRDAANGKLYGQVILYGGFAVLFLLDFFLFLRRDGFRASWSATFLMMLAAFVVGESVGRWNSSRMAADDRDGFDR
jgi:hypothetical protein